MFTRHPGEGRQAALTRLRRVFEDGQQVGASTPLPELRPRRLLRFVSKPARDEALPCDRSPDRVVLRAGRGLVVVLRSTRWRWRYDSIDASLARLLRRRALVESAFPGHHRSSERQQEQVRAGQGNRPAAARSRPVQRRPLSGRLRLHPADVLRRRRSARRAGARAGAGASADDRRGARDRRDADARREGHRRQDRRGERRAIRRSPTTPTSASCPRTCCARSAGSSRTTRSSSTSR